MEEPGQAAVPPLARWRRATPPGLRGWDDPDPPCSSRRRRDPQRDCAHLSRCGEYRPGRVARCENAGRTPAARAGWSRQRTCARKAPGRARSSGAAELEPSTGPRARASGPRASPEQDEPMAHARLVHPADHEVGAGAERAASVVTTVPLELVRAGGVGARREAPHTAAAQVDHVELHLAGALECPAHAVPAGERVRAAAGDRERPRAAVGVQVVVVVLVLIVQRGLDRAATGTGAGIDGACLTRDPTALLVRPAIAPRVAAHCDELLL